MLVAGLVLGGIGAIVMAPPVIGEERVDRWSGGVNTFANNAGSRVRRTVPGLLIGALIWAVAIAWGVLDAFSHTLTETTSKDLKTVIHWAIILGAVVPVGLVVGAIVLAVLMMLLWLASCVASAASSSRTAVIRTGAFILVLGVVVGVVGTLMPDGSTSAHQPASTQGAPSISSTSTARSGATATP